jgi:hypothetical protein
MSEKAFLEDAKIVKLDYLNLKVRMLYLKYSRRSISSVAAI